MPPTELTVTEAVRNFSEYINRVVYRHERFVLRKGRRAVAELRPIPSGRRLGDLPAILRTLPRLSPAEAAAFGEEIESARASFPEDSPDDPWAF